MPRPPLPHETQYILTHRGKGQPPAEADAETPESQGDEPTPVVGDEGVSDG